MKKSSIFSIATTFTLMHEGCPAVHFHSAISAHFRTAIDKCIGLSNEEIQFPRSGSIWELVNVLVRYHPEHDLNNVLIGRTTEIAYVK